MSTASAKEVERHLRRRGWTTERDKVAVRVVGRGGRHVWAVLLVDRNRRPWLGLMDLSVGEPGTGLGTELVDDLVAAARATRLHGLSFADASEGAHNGGGYWRRYVSRRRDLRLEREGMETRLVLPLSAPARASS